MIIESLIYKASGLAASQIEIFTMYITLLNKGQIVDYQVISGYASVLNGSSIPALPVEADSMTVEANDLDFDTHSLVINGKQYDIPRTGNRSVYFDVPDLAKPAVIEKRKITEIIPTVAKPTETSAGADLPEYLANIQAFINPPAASSGPADHHGISLGVVAVILIGAVMLASRKKKV